MLWQCHGCLLAVGWAIGCEGPSKAATARLVAISGQHSHHPHILSCPPARGVSVVLQTRNETLFYSVSTAAYAMGAASGAVLPPGPCTGHSTLHAVSPLTILHLGQTANSQYRRALCLPKSLASASQLPVVLLAAGADQALCVDVPGGVYTHRSATFGAQAPNPCVLHPDPGCWGGHDHASKDHVC